VVLGTVLLALVVGSCAAVAWLVVERSLPWLAEAPRVLALAVVFTAAVVGVHLVPGALGLLEPTVVAAIAIALAAAVWTWLPRTDCAREEVERPPGWAWAPAVLAAGCGLMLLRELAGAPVTSVDAQNFQVPIPVRWLQSDSVWGLHQFFADYSNATYPHNGNLLVTAVMLPFDSAFLARLVAAPYWALAGVGVYALAREVGAPRAAAPLAGAAFVVVPVMARVGLEGVQTDAPMLACLAAGALFLLRHHRTGERGELILAGVALGLAFGTKWYAVPGVAAVLAVWVLARGRRAWPDATWLAGLIALAGGFWLLRNLVETSNPLFPQPLGPFPAPPDPLREQAGFTLLHYATDVDVWRTYLRPAFAETFGRTGLLLAGGAVLAGVLRPRGPALAVLAATLLLALLYAVTPYSAFGPEGRPVLAGAGTRYGLPALMGAAVMAAWLAGRAWPAYSLLVIATVSGLIAAFELGVATVAVGAVGVTILALLPRRALLAVAAVASVVCVAVSADRANEQGYGQFDPAIAWIEDNAPSGSRIGLAGVWSPDAVSPALPAFGPRFGNVVEYVGVFDKHMLRRHDREAGFARAAAAYDLLLLGDGRERAWAERAGWSAVARSDRLLLLRRSTLASG
jgi:4-amino-4-deoxy-L-arabinose transferase-like glycosyltransferase